MYKNRRSCQYFIGQHVSVIHPDKLILLFSGFIEEINIKDYGFTFKVKPLEKYKILNEYWKNKIWPEEWIRKYND